MARKTIIEGDNTNGFLTRQDVAARFGVAPQTITRWANQGVIPHVRTLGGHRRYPAGDIQRLLTSAWAPSEHVPQASVQQPARRTQPRKADYS